jgi:BirA family transcriptional regulator, biotin operon repressor / biotin---[acetyl-CoA-carboxylase] ligase
VAGQHGALGRTEPKPDEQPEGWPPGWNVEHVATTGSTNDDLLATADERPDRSVLIADYQHAGRGRRERVWTSMPGENLLASILFHEVPSEAMELPRRVCLATVDACRRFTDAPVALKWPNDVLLDDRKLAGVLAQRSASGSVVVGIGVNVGWAPDGAGRLGPDVAPRRVLAELLAAYDRLPASAHQLRDRYRTELVTLGRRVRVELPDGEILGVATDLAFDGRLVVVDDAGEAHRLSVGDVVHLRVQKPEGRPGPSR